MASNDTMLAVDPYTRLPRHIFATLVMLVPCSITHHAVLDPLVVFRLSSTSLALNLGPGAARTAALRRQSDLCRQRQS